MNNKPPASHTMKFAVTGAAGFIGRRIVARLAGDGATVTAIDRVPKPVELPSGVEYRCANLGEGFSGLPEECILVHLAWNMDRANVEAQAASLADFTRLLGTKGLRGVVGLGSAEEYGELEGKLSEEMAPGRHLSAYGQAKHEACRALARWSRESGCPAIWLRPFIVYGPGQGENMAIPYALRCAKDRSPADFSEGRQFRDFIHVDDVAEGIAQAALKVAGAGGPFAVCNLGRGEPVRLRDVLERIADQTSARDLFHFGARLMREGEPETQFADVSAAKRLLGWHAQISWKSGIDALCKENEKDNHG